MDELDLDFTELELGSDIDNLKLLRKQLNSVQSIRYEQQRKDELIVRLKERVYNLERESRSYEDIKEHVLLQSRHVMTARDKEMQGKLDALHEQMDGLRQQVLVAEEEKKMNLARLDDANTMIAKLQGKLARQKDAIAAEQKKSLDLQNSLEGSRRKAVEKEAALSLEIHKSDKHIQQLKSALHEKHAELTALQNEYDLRHSQMSAKFFEELKAAKDEASRWKHTHDDLDKSTREWKQFSESALAHEKTTSSQFEHTCAQLQEENIQCSKMYASDIAERNAVIEELQQAVQSTAAELTRVREAHARNLEEALREKDSAWAQEAGELQKEVGALQVGLCLQKEMKDGVQHTLDQLKTCLRSLALDLTRSFGQQDEEATRKYYLQLCDLFDRLLVSGALGPNKDSRGTGMKSSENWEDHVSHMHSYINQHSALVASGDPSSPGAVSRYGKSLNIDSDFLSIIKSLKDLLQHVLREHGAPSSAARREITRLVEHIQLLRSDLDQSDMLMLSLVSQLMDERFVNAADLREHFHTAESIVNSFNAEGELEAGGLQFQSGSKQRAILHAKLCTGVSEAIRSAKLARSDLKKEREDYDSLLHELDIMKMKLEIDSRHHKQEGSPAHSPYSHSLSSSRY